MPSSPRYISILLLQILPSTRSSLPAIPQCLAGCSKIGEAPQAPAQGRTSSPLESVLQISPTLPSTTNFSITNIDFRCSFDSPILFISLHRYSSKSSQQSCDQAKAPARVVQINLGDLSDDPKFRTFPNRTYSLLPLLPRL